MTFAEKVKSARELREINQQALAEMMGVSRRTVVAWETTDAQPHASRIRKLAEVLQVSTDYLMNDDITDPTHGIEKQPYVEEARERYGAKAAKEINFLMERNNALFAGGEISDDAKEAYFQAVMKAYLECKEAARQTYGRKGKKEA